MDRFGVDECRERFVFFFEKGLYLLLVYTEIIIMRYDVVRVIFFGLLLDFRGILFFISEGELISIGFVFFLKKCLIVIGVSCYVIIFVSFKVFLDKLFVFLDE